MIKEDVINYKNIHKESRLLMNTIIGEFDRIGKNPTEQECISVIKTMMDGNKQTGNLAENKTLELFLPNQLSKSEIEYAIGALQFTNIGDCMKYFKLHFTGLYDGKIVSECFKLTVK